jgi:hypothetical protein
MNHLQVTGTVNDETNNLMLLHYQGADYLVYKINFNSDNPVGDWESYVNAKTGALIKAEDIACYYHSNKEKIKPLPLKKPYRVTVAGTGNVFDPDPLTTALAAYGGSYVDGSDANTPVLTAQLKSVTLRILLCLPASIHSLALMLRSGILKRPTKDYLHKQLLHLLMTVMRIISKQSCVIIILMP